jgi:peptide/nickel transport system substrate-binding protein
MFFAKALQILKRKISLFILCLIIVSVALININFGNLSVPQGISLHEKTLLAREENNLPHGELILPISRDHFLNNLDPASWNGPIILHKLIYEGLLDEGENGSILPSLAKSYEISSDGLIYTFYLKEGVKFSNGLPFNSEVALQNLERWVNNDIFSSLEASHVNSIVCTEPYTIVINFKESAYTILRELAYPRPVRFVEPSMVSMDGSSSSHGHIISPIGTGPYMLENYSHEELTLVPNPYYHGESPKVARLRFKVIKDGQARLMALRNKELDIAGGELLGSIPLESLKNLRNDKNFNNYLSPALGSVFLSFNNDTGKFNNLLLRKAISQSINRYAISEELFDGQVGTAKGLFQEGVSYITKENNFVPPYDPNEAIRLFKEAGYTYDGSSLLDKDGKQVTFTLLVSADENPEWKTLGEYIQASLAEQGIKISIRLVSRNLYYDAINIDRDTFDMAIVRTYSDLWMPHGFLADFFGEIPGSNVSRFWTDPYYRDLVHEAMHEMDEEKRRNIYDKVFTYISFECLTVPLYFQESYFFSHKSTVAHFEPGVSIYSPINWLTLEAK